MPKVENKIKIGYSNLNRSFFSRYFLLINKRHDTLNKINTWKNLEKLSLMNILSILDSPSKGVK